MRADISVNRAPRVESVDAEIVEVGHDVVEAVERVADQDAVVAGVHSGHHAFGQTPNPVQCAHLEIVGENHRRPGEASMRVR